jgi:N6-adenosine-specific RNA methylase IME4
MAMIGGARHSGDLPFDYSTAHKLMAIARDERLAKFAPVQTLPPVHKTLYQITRLSDDALAELVRNGTINSHCSFSDINREIRLKRIAEDRARIAGLSMIDHKFGTLVVDPPWPNDWYSEGEQARLGYATMTVEELVALKVERWAARHRLLWLLVPNNFMPVACDLVMAWGFQHRSVLTWVKTDSKGKPRGGRGHYLQNFTEHVLVATRGEAKTLCKPPSYFPTPVGKQHSEKPEKFYEIVRAASPMPAGKFSDASSAKVSSTSLSRRGKEKTFFWKTAKTSLAIVQKEQCRRREAKKREPSIPKARLPQKVVRHIASPSNFGRGRLPGLDRAWTWRRPLLLRSLRCATSGLPLIRDIWMRGQCPHGMRGCWLSRDASAARW